MQRAFVEVLTGSTATMRVWGKGVVPRSAVKPYGGVCRASVEGGTSVGCGEVCPKASPVGLVVFVRGAVEAGPHFAGPIAGAAGLRFEAACWAERDEFPAADAVRLVGCPVDGQQPRPAPAPLASGDQDGK